MARGIPVGLGAMALITAAVGAPAPAAFAADLAEGVFCSDHICRNDTADIYRVQIRVKCSSPGSAYEMSVWVNGHSTEEMQVGCNGHWEQGPMRLGAPSRNPDGTWSTPPMEREPGRYVPSSVTGIDYLSATVDNSSRRRPAPVPSGS
ncbi:hypothetical protein [Nocardia tengchongensis]